MGKFGLLTLGKLVHAPERAVREFKQFSWDFFVLAIFLGLLCVLNMDIFGVNLSLNKIRLLLLCCSFHFHVVLVDISMMPVMFYIESLVCLIC